MKLVVGLGNPDRRYSSTRHNVGFRVADCFASRHGLSLSTRKFHGRFGRGRACGLDVGVLEPQTYMNLSGQSVAEAVRFLPVGDLSRDLLVVFDDVDLPFGRLRLRPSGGSGGHKGLEDIIARLAAQEFPRLRFGIGRPAGPPDAAGGGARMDTTDYVLRPFSEQEQGELDERVAAATDAIEAFLVDGMAAAMNRFNREAPTTVAEPNADS